MASPLTITSLSRRRSKEKKPLSSGQSDRHASIAHADPGKPKRADAGSHVLFAVALIFTAFNLRTVFSSTSSLLPEIVDTYQLSPFGAGILTTLPVLCLGIFSAAAPALGRSIGFERALLVAITTLTLALALRGITSVELMYCSTALAGACIAIANVLLPSLVKQRYPDNVAAITGGYTMAMCTGAALAAALTLPISKAIHGSVEGALAAWAFPALLAALFWFPAAVRAGGPKRIPFGPAVAVWRSRLSWQVTMFMGLQSAGAYCVYGWLIPILRERGIESTTAGIVVGLSVAAQGIGCLVAPRLAVRRPDQKMVNLIFGIIVTIAIQAMLFSPLWTIWMWTIVLGFGQGALVSLALTVIVLRSSSPLIASRLSALAQFVGYLLASFGPLLVGVIRDSAGSFAWCSVLFGIIGVGVSVNGWLSGRPLFVTDGQ